MVNSPSPPEDTPDVAFLTFTETPGMADPDLSLIVPFMFTCCAYASENIKQTRLKSSVICFLILFGLEIYNHKPILFKNKYQEKYFITICKTNSYK